MRTLFFSAICMVNRLEAKLFECFDITATPLWKILQYKSGAFINSFWTFMNTEHLNKSPPSAIYASVHWVGICSGNGLSPVRRQAITWTDAELLPFAPIGTNFSEIWIEILTSWYQKIGLKMSSVKVSAMLSRGEGGGVNWHIMYQSDIKAGTVKQSNLHLHLFPLQGDLLHPIHGIHDARHHPCRLAHNAHKTARGVHEVSHRGRPPCGKIDNYSLKTKARNCKSWGDTFCAIKFCFYFAQWHGVLKETHRYYESSL